MLANCFLGHHRYFPPPPTDQTGRRDPERLGAVLCTSLLTNQQLAFIQQPRAEYEAAIMPPGSDNKQTTNKQFASIKNKPKAEYEAPIMPPGSDTPPLSSGKTRQAGPTGQNYFPRCFLLIINSSAALLAIYHSGLHHRLSLVLRLYLLPQRRHKLGKLCPNNAVAANPLQMAALIRALWNL